MDEMESEQKLILTKIIKKKWEGARKWLYQPQDQIIYTNLAHKVIGDSAYIYIRHHIQSGDWLCMCNYTCTINMY